ncbi:MAG: TetR/AcrR family transcriptional regulator [Actinoplanes sp.]
MARRPKFDGAPARHAGPELLPSLIEGTRGLILRESLLLFAERGYGATTVRDIAERVGILSGSLYAHFPSKEEILSQLVEMGMIEHRRSLHEAALANPTDPKSQLSSLMRTHVTFHARYATLAMVLHAEMHVLTPAKAEHLTELREQSAQLFRDAIRDGAASQVFDVPDVEVAAAAIVSIGVRVAYWYSPSFHLDIPTLADQLAEIACRIVAVT